MWRIKLIFPAIAAVTLSAASTVAIAGRNAVGDTTAFGRAAVASPLVLAQSRTLSRSLQEQIGKVSAQLGSDPRNAALLNKRGLLYYRGRDYDRALADFNAALAINADFYQALNNRAQTQYNQRKYVEAIADWTRVIAMKPGEARYRIRRGLAYIRAGKRDDALADYGKAIDLKPNNAAYRVRRGNLYLNLRDNTRALEDYTRAIALNPKYAYAYYSRAWIRRERTNEFDLALSDYTRSIDLNPKFTAAWYERGLVHEKRRDWNKAIQDFSRAIQNVPRLAQYRVARGRNYLRLEKYDLAAADYSVAVSRQGNNASYLNQYAWVLFKAGNGEKGLSSINKALKLKPKIAAFWDTRAHIHEAGGRIKLAVADYQEALRLNPNLRESRDALDRLRRGGNKGAGSSHGAGSGITVSGAKPPPATIFTDKPRQRRSTWTPPSGPVEAASPAAAGDPTAPVAQ